MNEVVGGVLRLVVRIVAVAMGLVLFLSLLAAAMVLALVWLLRAFWARLLATPWSAWMTRVDPRTGFRTVYRSAGRWSAPASASGGEVDEPPTPRRGGVLPGAAEVTDVQAREVREP